MPQSSTTLPDRRAPHTAPSAKLRAAQPGPSPRRRTYRLDNVDDRRKVEALAELAELRRADERDLRRIVASWLAPFPDVAVPDVRIVHGMDDLATFSLREAGNEDRPCISMAGRLVEGTARFAHPERNWFAYRLLIGDMAAHEVTHLLAYFDRRWRPGLASHGPLFAQTARRLTLAHGNGAPPGYWRPRRLPLVTLDRLPGWPISAREPNYYRGTVAPTFLDDARTRLDDPVAS